MNAQHRNGMSIVRFVGRHCGGRRIRGGAAVIRTAALVPLFAGLAACQSAQVMETGSLSSYKDFVASDGMVTKTKYRVDSAATKNVKTVHVIPTTFAATADLDKLGDPQRSWWPRRSTGRSAKP